MTTPPRGSTPSSPVFVKKEKKNKNEHLRHSILESSDFLVSLWKNIYVGRRGKVSVPFESSKFCCNEMIDARFEGLCMLYDRCAI